MHRAIDRRRLERRISEMNSLRMRQELLLREAVRAEVMIYNHMNPLAIEFVLNEGIWDSIKDVAARATEFGKEVASDFKKGWERVSSVVSEALSSVTNEIMEKVKSFIDSITKIYGILMEKVKSYGEEKVRRFMSVFKHEYAHAEEGKALAEESKTKGCVDDAIEALGEKAEEMNVDSPRIQMSLREGRVMARSTRLMVESGSRRVMKERKDRRLIKEAFDPFSISGIILAFGSVMLMFKALAAVFKFIGGNCASFWTKASTWCQTAYDKMHHFEEAALDTLVPDIIAAGFYDFYIYCGLPPVEEDPGNLEQDPEKFGTGFESGAYQKGKFTGKIGSERDVAVKELEDNDKFRRSVKKRMYQLALLIMLADALKTLTVQGFSALYGVKSAVKTGELGVVAAAEVSTTARAGRAATGG